MVYGGVHLVVPLVLVVPIVLIVQSLLLIAGDSLLCGCMLVCSAVLRWLGGAMVAGEKARGEWLRLYRDNLLDFIIFKISRCAGDLC